MDVLWFDSGSSASIIEQSSWHLNHCNIFMKLIKLHRDSILHVAIGDGPACFYSFEDSRKG